MNNLTCPIAIKRLTQCALIGILALFCSCQSDTTTVETSSGQIEMQTDELLKVIGEAYVYGYPMVLMDLSKQVITNVEVPHPVKPNAPINQLGHYRRFPDHTLTAVVKPNVDTYYSIAWFDLKAGPHVLSMPATERYYLLPFYDAHTNVYASPGTRTTGSEAQVFLVAGPDWTGETPEGMSLIQSPTNMTWLLGRIQVNSLEDGASLVAGIQDKMELVPLDAYGDSSFVQPKGKIVEEYNNIVPVKTIEDIDVNSFLNRLAMLLKDNPADEGDSLMIRRMAKIGLVPGEPFELTTDNFVLKTKLKMLPGFIHDKFRARRSSPDPALINNGWASLTEGLGEFGTDYAKRAYIDFIGLGVNLPEDAIYPNCIADVNGDPLDASVSYQLHFEADELPPVKAFWSLTAYNSDEFLIENEIGKYALGDRDDLVYNEDGSLDLYIQTEQPQGAPIDNWLPIPEDGDFYLTMRLYWPKERALSKEWVMPPVVPVDEE